MGPQPVLVRSPWNDPYIEREREIVGILPEKWLVWYLFKRNVQ